MEKNKEKQNQLQKILLSQQVKQIEAQLEQVSENIEALTKLKLNVEDLSKLDKKSKSFFALGGGIFVQGEIEPVKEVLMNVGAGVTVKKDVKKAKEILDNQINELLKLKEKIQQDLSRLTLQLNSVA